MFEKASCDTRKTSAVPFRFLKTPPPKGHTCGCVCVESRTSSLGRTRHLSAAGTAWEVRTKALSCLAVHLLLPFLFGECGHSTSRLGGDAPPSPTSRECPIQPQTGRGCGGGAPPAGPVFCTA